MNNILGIGRSGLNSMQNKMDAIADDLANLNSIGYKRKEVNFQELLNNTSANGEVRINAGSKSGLSTINFSQGQLIDSPNMYHMAIEGNGFFGVRDEHGNLMLTRNGGFNLDSSYNLVDESGYYLDYEVYQPVEEWGRVDINTNGEIYAQLDGEGQLVGKIILYMPEIRDTLVPLGEGRFLPSQNVTLYNSSLNNDGFGSIKQYYLENSNVDITKSMAEMITTQRAYSLNTKSIQTTDEIMSMINNIKR